MGVRTIDAASAARRHGSHQQPYCCQRETRDPDNAAPERQKEKSNIPPERISPMGQEKIAIHPYADRQHDRGELDERPNIPCGQTFPPHLVCHNISLSLGTLSRPPLQSRFVLLNTRAIREISRHGRQFPGHIAFLCRIFPETCRPQSACTSSVLTTRFSRCQKNPGVKNEIPT